jgi:error-prone DNA polymerase
VTRGLGYVYTSPAAAGGRRADLWRLGVARGAEAKRGNGHAQLALPLPLPQAPALRGLDAWGRMLADYASTGMTLDAHPIELMRPGLPDSMVRASDLGRLPSGRTIELVGLVVARQRPATANGVVFMLLEDESGTVNLIIPPPVYAQDRLAVRTATFARVTGRLERRDGVVNVLAASVKAMARPDMPLGEVKHIEPPTGRETGRPAGHDFEEERRAATAGASLADLAAVAPGAHSFGRRGHH